VLCNKLARRLNCRRFITTSSKLSLNDAPRHIEFACILYNLLCVDINKGQNDDMSSAVCLLNVKVRARGLKSMHTNDATKKVGRKRARTGDDDGAGGGEGDHAQLRAHGHEVKLDVILWMMTVTNGN
jgi:hypothetical protein